VTPPAGPLGRFLSTRVPAGLQFGAGALLMAGFLAQSDLVLRTAEFAALLAIVRLTGRRLRPLPYLLMSAGVIASNLIVPIGRELASVIGFAITETALKSGVAKALTLVGMIAASQFSIRPDLRLPGRFGGLLARSLLYFQRIMAERRSIDRRDPIGSIDAVLMEVHGAGSAGRGDAPRVRATAAGALVLAGVVCLTWAPIAATLLLGGPPFWGR
jgi:heptaprenyl diphosphate synthase